MQTYFTVNTNSGTYFTYPQEIIRELIDEEGFNPDDFTISTIITPEPIIDTEEFLDVLTLELWKRALVSGIQELFQESDIILIRKNNLPHGIYILEKDDDIIPFVNHWNSLMPDNIELAILTDMPILIDWIQQLTEKIESGIDHKFVSFLRKQMSIDDAVPSERLRRYLRDLYMDERRYDSEAEDDAVDLDDSDNEDSDDEDNY